MANQQEAEKETPERNTQSPSFQTVYSNAASLVRTPFDVRINFGLTKTQVAAPVDGSISMMNEIQTTVIMSPQHAKVLAYIFLREVKIWEAQYGAIPLTPEFLKRLDMEVIERDIDDPDKPLLSVTALTEPSGLSNG